MPADNIDDTFRNLSVEPDPEPVFDTQETTPSSPWEDEGTPGETRPSTSGPRTKVDDLFTMAWAGFGTLLVRQDIDKPVGRTMQFQAPLAGQKFDELVAGTFLDKLLQPLAKKQEQMEAFGAVVAMPIIVAIVERKPEAMVMLAPFLEQMVLTSLEAMAPLAREQKNKARAQVRAIDALAEDLNLEKGENPIPAILANIFNGGAQPQEEEPSAPDVHVADASAPAA